MTLEEQIELFERNAQFERKDGDLQGCLNFRQLAEWLKDYKRLLGAIDAIKAEIETYENDCMLSCPNNDDCRDCNETTFKSIYNIIEKHTSGKEQE